MELINFTSANFFSLNYVDSPFKCVVFLYLSCGCFLFSNLQTWRKFQTVVGIKRCTGIPGFTFGNNPDFLVISLKEKVLEFWKFRQFLEQISPVNLRLSGISFNISELVLQCPFCNLENFRFPFNLKLTRNSSWRTFFPDHYISKMEFSRNLIATLVGMFIYSNFQIKPT